MFGEAVRRCMAGLTLLNQDAERDALDVWKEDPELSLLVLGSMVLGMLDAREINLEVWATKAASKEWD